MVKWTNTTCKPKFLRDNLWAYCKKDMLMCYHCSDNGMQDSYLWYINNWYAMQDAKWEEVKEACKRMDAIQ
ncbi:uncharacterized protein ACA1_342840 [Acanthamoeba castellanii str. Neff]|uniref:Uncharacterized protein n=1 Tax=Acanthamoeba castellanii (strain ATCC 30010 / Neff) TaxID=1257118 RepID=L8HDA5_ACACF|nr:uncharacterized protein ACA1_342840 [Acanthamoeba castellanii str. Neff]ELR23150.1 hypothetical protein ACA1_342840 [Acanthamoeba castellanii str. Neff]